MPRKIDLTNQKFNKLTVIKETSQRNASGSILWECQCECGNKTLASGTELKRGHKKSCGCLQKEIIAAIGHKNLIDLTNKQFGKLKVIKIISTKKMPSGSTKIYWLCECDCGNTCIVEGNSLRTGNTKSCGCVKSFGEQKIAELLRQYGISFEKEKIFDYDTLYRYDFYVNNNYIIEYDGKQHFENYSWGSKEYSLDKSQIRDQEKNLYCFKNNIPIIRIPYTHYSKINIEDLLLETSQFKLKNPLS